MNIKEEINRHKKAIDILEDMAYLERRQLLRSDTLKTEWIAWFPDLHTKTMHDLEIGKMAGDRLMRRYMLACRFNAP